MTRIGARRLIPLLFIAMGLTFGILGYTKLGFWNSIQGPRPGFFPTIMSVVMVLTSIAALFQASKEAEEVKYQPGELLAVAAGIGIFVSTFIIGLVPTIVLYVVLWLKLLEKSSWKSVFIVLATVMFITIGVFGMWLGIQFPMGIFQHIL